MARFKDANPSTSDSSAEDSHRGWEPLNLENLPVVIEDEEPEDQLQIEVETDDTADVSDATTSDVVENSERVPSRSEVRIRELVKKSKDKDAENAQLRQQLLDSQKASATNRQAEIEARKKTSEELIKSYTAEYEKAVMDGDVKGQAALTAKMTKAHVESMALDTLKAPEPEQAVLTQRTVTNRESIIEKLPEAGKVWAEKNKWFVSNSHMTQQAVGIAGEVEAEGYSAEEPEYYVEIEKRMAEMYPTRFNKEPVKVAETPKTPDPVRPKQSPVAQTARSAPTQKAGTVRLTKEDMEYVRKWKIPPERYAAEKAKIEKADKSGNRTTTIFE